ncbi:MAG TPA: chemotaxis response regulator protein-glutamate methylesterase [Acidobacteriaceae bacterium]|nr:chemotaxis response regulator protein-glutamate methylesterase [Acidobacteriaceae bacterium]
MFPASQERLARSFYFQPMVVIAMRKIRVLVVDDSVVIRRMVSDVLADELDIEVAGAAADGRIALQKIEQVNPDILTLDVEMPVMDGLETLKQLRKTHRHLPVIMFSTLTERGASATMDALALGASDYVTKPANVGSAAAALEKIRAELIPKIRAHVPQASTSVARPFTLMAAQMTHLPSVQAAPRSATSRVEVVAIGTSTGGPNALGDLVPLLPPNFPVPVVIVQHMPPIFTKFLADRLSSKSQIPVMEAANYQELLPGHAYIAPGDFHMMVERSKEGVRIRTQQEQPENSCRPAVDVLFRSVADVYGGEALAVIMTGMGQDGLRGCGRIREAGGQILAQDEATSVVWGMPGYVANAGLADGVLPLGLIAGEIVRRVAVGRMPVTRPRLTYYLNTRSPR